MSEERWPVTTDELIEKMHQSGDALKGLVADAPRPRGKRHSVKPWREEVRDMMEERCAAMMVAHEAHMLRKLAAAFDAERDKLRAEAAFAIHLPRPWYRRLADWIVDLWGYA